MFRTYSSLLIAAAVATAAATSQTAQAQVDPGLSDQPPMQAPEKMRTPEAPRPPAESRVEGTNDTSYVDRFFATVARTLPLSPILFPLRNEVSVVDWMSSCIASSRGWGQSLTCYGGGFGMGEEEQPAPKRTPSAT